MMRRFLCKALYNAVPPSLQRPPWQKKTSNTNKAKDKDKGNKDRGNDKGNKDQGGTRKPTQREKRVAAERKKRKEPESSAQITSTNEQDRTREEGEDPVQTVNNKKARVSEQDRKRKGKGASDWRDNKKPRVGNNSQDLPSSIGTEHESSHPPNAHSQSASSDQSALNQQPMPTRSAPKRRQDSQVITVTPPRANGDDSGGEIIPHVLVRAY